MFGDLNSGNEVIKESGDVLGGGGLFDSNIYEFNIVAAYGGKSQGGARSVTLEVKEEGTGRTFKTTQWVTSGDAKGNKNYYEKDGEKNYLPGYELINAVVKMTTNKDLHEAAIETKTLKIWDNTAKAEVPTQVPVLVELTGKKVYLGVLKQLVNKQAKDDAGNYADTAETREINELNRVFHHPSKKTMAEAKAGSEAEFFDKWKEKWAGKVQNKVKEVAGGTAGKASRPAGNAGAGDKPSSLFG